MATIDELKTNVDSIKTEKDENLLPENLKTGVTCLGIEGAFTADANAVANDMLSGKTAYVNGEKITGSIEQINGISADADEVTLDTISSKVIGKNTETTYNGYINSNNISINIPYANLTNIIGLTADKIATGNTILGIVGTYTGGVEELESQITQLQEEKKSLQSQVTQLTSDKESLSQQVTQLTADKSNLEQQVETLTNTNTQLTNDKEELEGQVETLTNTNNQLNESIENYESQINAINQTAINILGHDANDDN